MDGRDTPPESGAGFLEALQREIRRIGVGRIATISGRYYAMDRDKRWERIERANDAMVDGNGEKATDPVAAAKRSYEKGVTDEFIEPVTIVDDRNEPVGLIRDDDACIFFNYRADRGREMTQALTGGSAEAPLHDDDAVRQVASPCRSCCRASFPTTSWPTSWRELNWKNLRVAETEKYAHVTYFFNGGNEKPYAGEEREMVPSPKVATYDLKPEMSAEGIAESWSNGHREARFRRDRDELRQRRHGRPFGQDGADGARGGSGGRLPRPHLRRA